MGDYIVIVAINTVVSRQKTGGIAVLEVTHVEGPPKKRIPCPILMTKLPQQHANELLFGGMHAATEGSHLHSISSA